MPLPARYHTLKSVLKHPSRRAGFTLIEMAVALVVLALLLGSILVPLQTQIEQRKISDTQKSLEQAMEALMGYAAANGRLPCPASAASNGIESPVGGGNCTNDYNGFLPAVTLGLSSTDAQGYLVDAWGLTQNRVRYAVTTANANAFTTSGGIRAVWAVDPLTLIPNLVVCSVAPDAVGDPTCTVNVPPITQFRLTDAAPAVIWSAGKNAATGGTGKDEFENPNANSANNDRVFVWHTQSGNNAPNGEFDDIVLWMSPNLLYSRLINAGQLP